MIDKEIYYIHDGNYPLVAKLFFEYGFKNWHIRECSLNSKTFRFSPDFSLVIFEPLKINNSYFSVYKVWKNYLVLHAPSSKIIVAGFLDYKDLNYINLLNLPKEPASFMAKAQAVCSNWSFPSDCTDILDQMKNFFKGHGKTSLIAHLIKVQQSLNAAHIAATEGRKAWFEALDALLIPIFFPEWTEFHRRWKAYYPLFEYLPVKPKIDIIGRTFDEISTFFKKKPILQTSFLKNQFDQKARYAIQTLIEIDQLYIRPELNNEK